MKKLSVKITKTNKKTLNDNKRNYFNCTCHNYCTKLLVPRNGINE